MFDKLFGQDELHKELEDAKGQILKLQGELLRKDLRIKAHVEKIKSLQTKVNKLAEELDVQKLSPDRFGKI